MARTATILTLIALTSIHSGCRLDAGSSQRMPPRTTTSMTSPSSINLANLTEADLAEQVALTRQEYSQALNLLADYYNRMGDNRKLGMADKELSSLNKMPQYDYLGDVIPGADLNASSSIPAADEIYGEAMQYYDEANRLVLLKKKSQLRLAQDKFKQVIRLYPSSDKIDDAAFHLGVIFEHFKDYHIAQTYYDRAYQWDARTPYPARFKSAHLLEKYLSKKDQALELYQDALNVEGTRHPQWREHAEEQIKQLRGVTDN